MAWGVAAQAITTGGVEVFGRPIVNDQADIEAMLDVIEEVLLSHPLGAVPVTLCGFGPRTGARTLAEIGDPNRFASGPNAKAYYQRKRAVGERHNAAVICVARRRCDLILAMLKNQTPSDPGRHQEIPIAA